MSLTLHCGAEELSLKDLAKVTTPEPTYSWHPIPHHELVNSVTDNLKAAKLEISNQKFGVAKDGALFFGLLEVKGPEFDKGYGLTIGLRNSHNRLFSAAIGVGSHVFVCDNLAFTADLVVFRRHTRFIMLDMPGVVSSAIGRLGDARVAQNQRIDAYQDAEIEDAQFHDLCCRCVQQGVVPPSRLPYVFNSWYKPEHPEFEPRTVWSAFNAVTETLKKNNVFEAPTRTRTLHGLCDLLARCNTGSELQPLYN